MPHWKKRYQSHSRNNRRNRRRKRTHSDVNDDEIKDNKRIHTDEIGKEQREKINSNKSSRVHINEDGSISLKRNTDALRLKSTHEDEA